MLIEQFVRKGQTFVFHTTPVNARALPVIQTSFTSIASPARKVSRLKIEDNQPLVLDHAGKSVAQMTVETGIVFQPPERGPAEHDVTRASLSQPLALTDRGCERLARVT